MIIPSSSTHPGSMTKRSENVRMNIKTLSITEPTIRIVEVGIRKYIWISKVDAWVEVQMGS